MAKAAKMTDEDRAQLARLITIYGMATVEKEARALGKPNRRRGPPPHPKGNVHAVWVAVEVRRDWGPLRRHSAAYACSLLADSLKLCMVVAPAPATLRRMHGKAAKSHRADAQLAARAAAYLKEMRAADMLVIPNFLDENGDGSLIDVEAAKTLGRIFGRNVTVLGLV